jgi:hypothetical protein
MTPPEVEAACLEYGLRNEGAFKSGLCVEFQDDHAVRIEVTTEMGLSLAGEPLLDPSNANVERWLAKLSPNRRSWWESEGVVVLHWELSDEFVFSFMVYSAGHRLPATKNRADARRRRTTG